MNINSPQEIPFNKRIVLVLGTNKAGGLTRQARWLDMPTITANVYVEAINRN